MDARERAYRQFYRQPHVIINTVKKIRSFRDVVNFARMLKDFLNWV